MVAGSVMSAALPGAPAWDVVVGDRFIAALAAPAPDTCTSAFAEAAADERVSIEKLVGLVPTGPADAVESFAIVWWAGDDPGEVTAVVRGNAVVDLTSPGGTRRFDAHGIRPWHLAEFGAVVAVRLTGVDAPLGRLGEATDPVRPARASLRASAVEWASAAPQRSTDVSTHADADTILIPRHRTDGVPPSAPDTIMTPEPSSRLGAGRRPPAPAPIDADLAGKLERPIGGPPDDLPATVPVTVIEASAPEAPEGPEVPTPRQPVPGPLVGSKPGPAFRIGTGPLHPITRPVLIGRRPLPPRIPHATGAAPELIAVASPRAIVSGTHLALHVEGERLIATDLRSTNGTIVRSAAGSRRMRAGESIVVVSGTSLDLGDDTIIEILTSPGGSPE